MTKDPNKGKNPSGEGDGDGDKSISPEDFEKLQEQVENLNKGISSYRSELTNTKEELSKTKETNEELQEKLEKAVNIEGDLSKEDQQKLESWAKSKGFVTASELEKKEKEIKKQNLKQIENQAVNEFLEQHPEYDDDENWNLLKQEFQLYKQPTTLTGYRKLLNRVHKTLAKDSEKESKKGEVEARLKQKGRLTLGGGSQKSPGGDETSELEKLQEKYPNLTQEQIKNRLSEVDSLYPEDEE